MALPLRPQPLFLGASLGTPILLCRFWHFPFPELVEEGLRDEEGQQAFAGVRAVLDDEEHLFHGLLGVPEVPILHTEAPYQEPVVNYRPDLVALALKGLDSAAHEFPLKVLRDEGDPTL
jgi:hypothetical protein